MAINCSWPSDSYAPLWKSFTRHKPCTSSHELTKLASKGASSSFR